MNIKRILFFIYQWLIAAPTMVVATLLTTLTTIIGSTLFSKNYWGYYPPKWWSRLWCAIHFVNVKVTGREKIDRQTSYVFVANHQGAYDIFSIYGYLGHPFRWMMRKGITNIPLVGTACRSAGHILVDTKSASGLKHTVEDAVKNLQDGISLVVFPEGRRTETGEMGTFKHGAFRLAMEFKLPIVPITIDGSYQVMPRTTFNVTPGTITLTLHEPIPVNDETNMDEVMELSRTAISSSLKPTSTDSHINLIH